MGARPPHPLHHRKRLMNRLTAIRVVSWLRREPFPISTVAVPLETGDDAGELLVGLPSAQVPSKERSSELRRSFQCATAPGRKGKVRPLKVDVHVPESAGPFPLVLYIPGGGFLVAPRQMARAQRAYVADAGYVVASIEYRTVNDDATFREGLADVCAAIQYLHDHAAEFKIDTRSMALWGESAGGYLASLAATTCVPAIPVNAVVTMVGGSDLSFVSAGFDEETAARWHGPTSSLTRYVGSPPPEEANPVSNVSPSTAPFLLFHGEDDRIISPRQSLLMHRALHSAGVRSRRVVLAGAGHGEMSFRRNDIKVWTSTALMDMVVGFLRQNA